MSLINQMLQDLEQRNAANPSGTNAHQHIRAVPERHRIHPAWWLVLLLTLALIGAGAWFWNRLAHIAAKPVAAAAASAANAVPAIAPTIAVTQPLAVLTTSPAPPVLSDSPTPAPAFLATPTTSEHAPDSTLREPTTLERKAIQNRASGAQNQHEVHEIMHEKTPETTHETSHETQDIAHRTSTISSSHSVDPAHQASESPVSAAPAIQPPLTMSNPSKSIVSSQKNSSANPAQVEISDEAVKAARLTKQFKQLTPQQLAENEFRKAVTFLQIGRQADAMASLEQALTFDPKHVAARQTLVGLLLQAKRNEDAIHKAQDGLTLDPTQTGLSMILARVQLEQNDLHSALATLERGLPYAAERADYQAFLAALLQRDKRNKEAVDHYTVALSKTPQNGVWWMGMGISLQAENRLPEAKEAFSRAKTSDSLTPELRAFVDQKLAQLN